MISSLSFVYLVLGVFVGIRSMCLERMCKERKA